MHRNINFSEVKESIDKAIKDLAFPGGVFAAGNNSETISIMPFGHHTYSKNREVSATDIFDLASLSKVCATIPAAMRLYEDKHLSLEDKVLEILPKIRGSNTFQNELKSKLTVRHLLNHSSGFPPDNDIYKLRNASIEEKWNALFKTPLAYFPGAKVIYSDVNMLLVQKIIEAVSKESLDKFIYKALFSKIGMESTFFNPPMEYAERILPTEYSIYNDAPLRGIVHDENARALGGATGHAGLFSNAEDLIKYAQLYLNHGIHNGQRIFKDTTIKTFIARDNSIPGSNRTLGWNTAYNPNFVIPLKEREQENLIWRTNELYEGLNQPSAGIYIDADAIGHTGFTGTSIWISFKYNIFVILLTNRVFFSRNYTHVEVFNYWRQKINTQIWKALGFSERNELNELEKPHFYHKAD